MFVILFQCNFLLRHLGKTTQKEMLRTRLLWFTAGFSLTGAAIGQFLWKDLWSDRYALSADAKQKFDAVEARVSNLESNLRQVEG